MPLLTKPQVEEWLRTPVTQELLAWLKERRDWLAHSRGQVFFAGEPNKTQEAILGLEAQRVEIESFIAVLERSEDFEEAFYDRMEPERRDAGRLSGAGQA